MSVLFAPKELVAGRFEIEKEVGRGGVGIVYRAIDRKTDQTVALKVIAIAGVDASEEARFQREGRILAELVHPNVVRLVDFGQTEDAIPYLAMEWLEGEDVAARVARAPLTMFEALDVAAQTATALAAAHEAGVIHRDVKPSNVFLVEAVPTSRTMESSAGRRPTRSGLRAKLVDFGVASAEDARLTRTGAILGTPAYMAPEQARGEAAIDRRADIYALGATLFELLAGRPPHIGPTPIAVLARLVTTPAPRLSDLVAVPDALDDLMSELLATHPADRPGAASQVAAALAAIADDLHAFTSKEPAPSRAREPTEEEPRSLPPPSGFMTSAGGSRLVTSILATGVPKGDARKKLLAELREYGADATELGGDAVVAHLGARKAMGDEAVRALDIALMVAKTGAHVGVATGRTRIDRTRPIGEVVDRAAALARDAAKGQVIADTTTTELARGRYEFQVRNDGSAFVGDSLEGRRDTMLSAGGAPFVGRDGELAQVLAAFERAAFDETPIVVSITGAPGMGKTRLRKEALTGIAVHPASPRVVLSRSEAFTQAHPLGTIGDLVRALAGIAKGQSRADATHAIVALETAGAKLDGRARELVARLATSEPIAAPGEDARGARDALWIALTDLVTGIARKKPLVIAIEDAQWADPESLSFLDHVLARAAETPLLVFATARPELWRDQAERFAGRDHVRVELRPLSKRAVRAIANALLSTRGENREEVVDSIASQAAGSPLFAEELARITAQGRDASSAPSIEAAMQVHLDALTDAARDAAMRLSVFGLVGWDAGLSALGCEAAPHVLRELAAADVVHELATSRFKEAREFAFKHALMREVAHNALGDDAKRELHARAGHWLAKVGEDDATVARHLELGGESRAAADYLARAARRALAANALADAVRMADVALAFAEDDPTRFSRAQLLDEAWARLDARASERETALGEMESAAYDEPTRLLAKGARLRFDDACGGGPEVAVELEALRAACAKGGLLDEEARTAATLAARYAFAGELDAAEKVAEELLANARKLGDASLSVDAWQTLAVVRQTRGDVVLALDARRSAARVASDAGLKTREATLTINVGFALTTMGAKEEARAAIEHGLAIAQSIGSPGTVRHGWMNLLGWSATFGTSPDLDPALAEAREIADAALSGWVPSDRGTLGLLFYRGLEFLGAPGGEAPERARKLLRAALEGYRATEMRDCLPVTLGELARAEQRAGDPTAALAHAEEGAKLLDGGSPSLLNEAPVFVSLYDLAVARGEPEAAKRAIERGLPYLLRRYSVLRGTEYAQSFLGRLMPNAALLRGAVRFQCLPSEFG